MRAQPQIEKPKSQDVASLLIPLEGRLLLAPNVSVAEIVPLGPIEPVSEAPDWFLGFYSWRDLQVPLLSFEALNGEARPQAGARARIAVFNGTGVSEDLPFLAILAQGLPRLARVSAEEIQEREGVETKAFELMPVSWAGEQAVIPDVPRIEQALVDFLESRR